MTKCVFEFELGDEVADTVTGIKGIVNARSEWLNGCHRYSIQPRADKKTPHIMPDSFWFDVQTLRKTGEGINKTAPVKKTRTGGPNNSSPRM